VRLPDSEAERLLLKHWAHLRCTPHFVQTELYVSTPQLVAAPQPAINECPGPGRLMVNLSHTFGIHVTGRPGFTREAQVRVLAHYRGFLSPMDLAALWEACNDRAGSPPDENSWMDASRSHLCKRDVITNTLC